MNFSGLQIKKTEKEAAKEQAATNALATMGQCVTDAASLRTFMENFKEEMRKLKEAREAEEGGDNR